MDGFSGAWVTRVIDGDIATFRTVSPWDSVDAIEVFAGTPADATPY